MFTISHKKVSQPFIVLTGGNFKDKSGVDIKKNATSIKRSPSGYRQGAA